MYDTECLELSMRARRLQLFAEKDYSFPMPQSLHTNSRTEDIPINLEVAH
jgi:hypothetical protein